jgi:hypothetical protein
MREFLRRLFRGSVLNKAGSAEERATSDPAGGREPPGITRNLLQPVP